MRVLARVLVTLVLIFGVVVSSQPAVAVSVVQQTARTVRVDLAGRSWLQASVNGAVAFEGVLEAGDSREWNGQQVALRIGNAGVVQVTVDGETLGPLGSEGEVVEQSWTASSQAPSSPTATVVPATSTPAAAATQVPTPSTAEPPAGTAEDREPGYYVVEAGDTLGAIAIRFDVSSATLIEVNGLDENGSLQAGQQLIIPGSDGSLPDPISAPAAPIAPERAGVLERMTVNARHASRTSNFYRTTWITYYGRPNVAIMGILGEFSIDDLVPRLQAQADAYDEANGPDMGVTPVLHLVYGMATKAPGDDGTYLAFLSDSVVMEYIERAQQEGWEVILDIQIGSLTPEEALSRGFPFLQYDNVHLALDPEFAMSHPDQERPGNPIGFVTAEEVNAAQRAMRNYMKENGISGRRVLLLHQFLDTMIQNKEDLAWVYKIDLTVTADGWGGPWPKVGKYNSFMSDSVKYTGFKLFYRWDEPLLTERQVLGIERFPEVHYMEITPNLIIYQ